MTERTKVVWGAKVCAAVLLAAHFFWGAPLWAEPRARLSTSLATYVAARSSAPIDVIV